MKILYPFFLFLLGAAGSLGFAPYYFWWATVLSIAVAYYLLKDRGYKYSFWWGAGYALATFYWAFTPMFRIPELWDSTIGGLLILALLGGIFFGGPFAWTTYTKATGWRRTLYFALAGAFVMWLREAVLPTGLMWNPLANITLPFPWLANGMSFVGAIGLTFILVGCIVSIPEYILSRKRGRPWQFLFFVPLILFGFAHIYNDEGMPYGKTIRIVQPALSVEEKQYQSEDKRKLQLIELSLTDMVALPDLLIWPETSYPHEANMLTRFLVLGTRLAAGANYREGGQIRNSLLYVNRMGYMTDMYHKVFLVPLRERVGAASEIITSAPNYAPGAGPRVIDDFVPLICYDIAYAGLLIPQEIDPRQPKFMLNISNTAWYDESVFIYQHVDMGRRLAIETGLPVIIANNIGLSSIINNRGKVLQSLPYKQAGYLDGAIPPHKITLYRQIGLNRMMLWIILLSGFVLVIFKKKDINGN